MTTVLRRMTAVAVCLLAGFLLFGERSLWVHTDRNVRHTDAVIALAGTVPEDRRRLQTAVELCRRKNATYLILPMRNRFFTWSWAVDTYDLTGIPSDSRVLIGRFGRAEAQLSQRYGGTFVEARKAVQMMRRLGLRSGIVVSSGYHMRRTALAFTRSNKNTGVEFSYHPVGAPDPFWWTRRGKIRQIGFEYQKLAAALWLYSSR